eukprot:TRINITY_DN2528_c0_g1_i11.p1 TRINITY_DN2528_c0_g1~~TRINITY_DN2528_c0_g1_i11.p1  ORF type:complete len:542 (-),score=130.01 TRINITY_DN2528_c0_g1_i11:2356-3981(-)
MDLSQKLKKAEEQRKLLEKKLDALQTEKAKKTRERLTLIEQINNLKESTKDIKAEIKAFFQKDQDYRDRIDALTNQLNEVKMRKNKREDELFDEINRLKEAISRHEKIQEEEEQNVKWDTPITTGPVTGMQVEIKGEWKGKSSGGSLNNITWVNNPQVFLTVEKNSNITFSIFQPKKEDPEEMASISFYIFRTYHEQKKRLIEYKFKEEDVICEAYFSTLKPSRVSKQAMIPSSPYPYVIVPATFAPNHNSDWNLLVKSNNEVTLELATEEHDWPKVTGIWDDNTAGGCTNFPTFVTNPMYSCVVTKPMNVKFHLFQSDVEGKLFDTLSVYVLKSTNSLPLTQKLLDYHPSLLVKHGSFTNPHEGSVEVFLQPGNYFIIPCTFNPTKKSSYVLRVLSDLPIPSLQPLADVFFLSIQGTWRGDKAGGSINDEVEWKKNDQYHLKLKQDMSLTIVLTQVTKDGVKPFGIGWSISAGSSRLPYPNPISQSSYRPNKKLQENVTLPLGDYIFVPTTFNAGEETDFEVKISSQDPQFSTCATIYVV